MVRPPRLGGKQKMGVFATRSPHRPNHLGLSLLKLERIETGQTCPHLLQRSRPIGRYSGSGYQTLHPVCRSQT